MTCTASWAAIAMFGKLVLSVSDRLKDGAMFLQQGSDQFATGGQVSAKASSRDVTHQAWLPLSALVWLGQRNSNKQPHEEQPPGPSMYICKTSQLQEA